MYRIALVTLSFLVVTLAHAASFDCAKAGTKVEHIICDTSEISRLDDELAVSYQAVLEEKTQARTVMQMQKQWLKRRNACADAICVKNAYQARLKSLASRERREMAKFYGPWVIRRWVGSGAVSEYSDAQVHAFLGKELFYSKDRVQYDGQPAIRPYYGISFVSKRDFEFNFKASLDDIGIHGQAITEVEIGAYTDKDNHDTWFSPGGIFLIKNANTLIMYEGGDFFELSRKR